jgi:hypothetical protein
MIHLPVLDFSLKEDMSALAEQFKAKEASAAA